MNSEILCLIGEVIRCKRQKRNMKQAELAALLNVTPQAVSRWEMGISYPDIAMVPKIAEVLCVTSDELLGIRKPDASLEYREDMAPVLNQSQVDSIFDYVPAPISGISKRVLIVDDADFLRTVLEDILTKRGHAVLQAKNGSEGLEVLRNEQVDVCVLDIVMPGMSGMEVLERIKKEQPGIKVVMLSAMSRKRLVEQALQLGADAFVVKPFQEECLIERIG